MGDDGAGGANPHGHPQGPQGHGASVGTGQGDDGPVTPQRLDDVARGGVIGSGDRSDDVSLPKGGDLLLVADDVLQDVDDGEVAVRVTARAARTLSLTGPEGPVTRTREVSTSRVSILMSMGDLLGSVVCYLPMVPGLLV